MELVFGEIDNYLVFLPRSKALQLEGIHLALSTATTWGELKQAVIGDVYEALVRRCRFEDAEAGGEDLVDRLEPTSLASLQWLTDQHSDGDYPDWPARNALQWIPTDIQQRFGKVVASTHNGDYLELAPDHEAAIVAAFEAHGYTCTRDDGLVGRANGLP